MVGGDVTEPPWKLVPILQVSGAAALPVCALTGSCRRGTRETLTLFSRELSSLHMKINLF